MARLFSYLQGWFWTKSSAITDTANEVEVHEGRTHIVSTSEDSHYLVKTPCLETPEFRNALHSHPPATSMEFSPTTVISFDGSTKDAATLLRSKILLFLRDTEFESAFLRLVVLVFKNQTVGKTLSRDVRAVLEEFQCGSVMSLLSPDSTVPEGPYFLRNGKLYCTWKLFPDVYEAFQLPVIHAPNSDSFEPVTCMVDGKLMIPVPSRLHYPTSPDKPLNGVRVTVKDIIDLKGVKTTCQSRSYERLYGACKKTAPIVSGLVSLGAVVLGKTKCTQFASSDQPTADWVDYHCPWNPRGDGYLTPRGSSTGTSVALAGYDWIDIGIGSDTGGSIRGPAAVMGLPALRPTHALDRIKNIFPIIPTIDTPGFVSRDIGLLHDVSIMLLETKCINVQLRPTKILYPADYWSPWPDDPAKEMMEAFVTRLEIFTSTERTVINLESEWNRYNPTGTGASISSYLQDVFMPLLWRGYYESLKPFFSDYETQYGVPPYVNPVIQYCMKRGSQISDAEVNIARERKAVYGKWLREHVLDGEGFKTIMVFPFGDIAPCYRDGYRKAPDDNPGPYNWKDREDHQASLAGIPCAVVPIGQVEYPSKVTGGNQLLPVSLSLMSGAGTDGALTGLIRDMAKAGHLPRRAIVGTQAFAKV